MEKHWFGTGDIDAAGTNGAAAGEYSYWFQGSAGVRNASHVPVSSGLGGVGHTIYFDGGSMAFGNIQEGVQSNWNIAANQAFVCTAWGGNLILDTTCTVGAGTTFTANPSAGFDFAARWLGDVYMKSGSSIRLKAGWIVNDGQAGGNLVLDGDNGGNAYIDAPSAGQAKTFHNIDITLTFGAYGNIAGLAGSTMTGALTMHITGGSTYVLPSGDWLTLSGPNAKAFGVKAAASTGGGLLVI